MKTHNHHYIRVIAVITVVYFLFFTSKSWMPVDREIRNENYDTVFDMDCWKVKINNAVYDKDNKTMSFDMYEYTSAKDKNDIDFTIYLGRLSSTKKPLEYTLKTIEPPQNSTDKANVISYKIVAENVPNNYWYVSVNMNCIPRYSTSTSTTDSKTDIFGFQNTIEKSKPNPVQKKVQLDYRKAIKNEE